MRSYLQIRIMKILNTCRTLLVIGGVTVFLVIFHSFFFLLYKMRLVCSRRYKIRKEKSKKSKTEALLDNFHTREEVEC